MPMPSEALATMLRRAAVPLLAIALVAGALVAYYGKLLFGGSLDALDWQQHVHFYEWIHMSLREHGALPLYLPKQYQTWTHSLAWLPESPILNPLVWLLYFVHAQAYLKLLFIAYATAGVWGAYLLARELGASVAVGALCATILGLQGFAVSNFVIGHHWVLGVYLWPFAALLFHRAASRGRDTVSTMGLGGIIALLVLSGYHHPAIWLVTLLGAWALLWAARERSLTPLRSFAFALLLAVGLSAARVLPSAYGFAAFEPPERFRGIPAGELLRVLTVGGPCFASGYGYSGSLVPFSWERDASVGILGAALILAGLWFARRTRESILMLVAVVMVVLAVDLGFGPWAIAGQRVPARLLSIFVFCCWLVAARGLSLADARLGGHERWRRLRAPLWIALIALVVAERYAEVRPWQDFGAGNPVVTRPWSPVLPRVESGEATVSVVEVSPNRLVWDVSAARPSELLLPVHTSRRWLEWRTPGFGARIHGRNVLVAVPAGPHRVEATFVPVGFHPGIAISLATLIGSGVFLIVRSRRRSKAAG
jgi:hypothetical protein